MSRAARWVPPMPGITPSVISGKPTLAVAPAIRKSQHRANQAAPERIPGDGSDRRFGRARPLVKS